MSVRTWLTGARPRTLPAAVVPVAVGTAAGARSGEVVWWLAALCVFVSLALQVGVNFANDYSDGVRGTDEGRTGPVRLVASGMARPAHVRAAAAASFGAAAVGGLAAAAATSWWLLAVGAASIAAGALYTGGPKPYGYMGLGEVFVFVFFGVVATCGSAFVATGSVGAVAAASSVPVGLLSVALLMANNLRDIPGDERSGKRTLAVRIGDAAMRRVFAATFAATAAGLAVVGVLAPWSLASLLGLAAAVGPVRRVIRGAAGRDLVRVLEGTARVQILVGALLAGGLSV
ncbi:MAG: 1,4-dihydroxy-2-naphthoate polyprenyltransferase [Acidobacteria bacterium]|nr:1,4-dihydroxy-2-naphthoate polyprenyltransferase [Acidobacteriota bacterium]